jgi:hypothetical protein
MNVTSKKWFKDQTRLYCLLRDMSNLALEDLDFIRETEGEEMIILDPLERDIRTARIKEIRSIFNELDSQYTFVPKNA